MTDFEVAVLGGGIAGCMTACLLADAGHAVALVEQRPLLMDGASGWNDGKLHLGYTFTGTPSLATAALMQQGAAVFMPTLERVIGQRLDDSWFGRPAAYIVDTNSLFDPETLWRRAQAVAALLSDSASRLPGLRRYIGDEPVLERLDPDLASEKTGQLDITAAWRTSERNLSSREVATRLRAAVAARAISVITARVEGASHNGAGWRVRLAPDARLGASVVVNCLWEGLATLDRQVAPDHRAELPTVIRHKVALFGTNAGLDSLTSSTRILGKFGDIATYANGDAYLSWYPAGLAGRSDDGIPPVIADREPSTVIAQTLAGLRLPPSTVEHPGSTWQVGGGYVVALGSGDIDRVGSLLHARDRPAVTELRPGFISVDTGKYTLGALMAIRAAGAARRRLSEAAAP